MRRVSGDVSLGGRVAYCPQTAWIQNATLVRMSHCVGYRMGNLTLSQRENITFGQPWDEDKVSRVFRIMCRTVLTKGPSAVLESHRECLSAP